MITADQVQSLLGSGGNVVGQGGQEIGAVGQVHLDDDSGQPGWSTVQPRGGPRHPRADHRGHLRPGVDGPEVTEAVPVERIDMDTGPVTENIQVNESVRTEQIGVDSSDVDQPRAQGERER